MLFLRILAASSMKPTTPYAAVMAVTTQTMALVGSTQSTVESTSVKSMSAPPMVGVPALERCDSGPSLRTTWPICLLLSLSMNHG